MFHNALQGTTAQAVLLLFVCARAPGSEENRAVVTWLAGLLSCVCVQSHFCCSAGCKGKCEGADK